MVCYESINPLLYPLGIITVLICVMLFSLFMLLKDMQKFDESILHDI